MNEELTGTISTYIAGISSGLQSLPVEAIIRVSHLLEEARREKRHVFIFGNGGSAATSSHFASDLAKGAICEGKPRIKAFALTDNVPLFSAWSNDSSYGSAFAEQLEGLAEPGDIAIAISGSGNSENVLNAAAVARAKGVITVGLTGFDGGKLQDKVDISVLVPLHNMRQVEDIHLVICHVITENLCNL